MNKLFLGLLLSGLVAGWSCKKEKDDTIPRAYVDLYLDLNLPSYIALSTPNNWLYIGGGHRGIIVYRKNQSDFIALERACTYDVELATAYVEVQSNNLTAIDSTCGSKFQITDGSINHGPASRPLVQYRADYNPSDNTLHIYN